MNSLSIGVGFHCGEPSDAAGIREYYKSLVAGGHTVFAKAASGTASLVDAQELAEDAIGIWRKVTFEWEGNEIDDVPNYKDDPERQARFYMDQIFETWPPELDKTRIYIETPNEVDKNEADWIGRYITACAKLALAAGHKFCGPAWATGEPEEEAWQTNGFLEYLALCEANPDSLAVSLHEYSLDMKLNTGDTDLVGRVVHLNTVCDLNNLQYPTVFISEFGWHSTEAPSADKAVPQIIEQMKWYLEHAPNVRGIAIWALDKSHEWDDIHQVVNNYMEPLAQAINATDWSAPSVPPPESPGYTSVIMLWPQKEDITFDMYMEMCTVAWNEYGRSMTSSHDNAMIMVLDGKTQTSHIIVWEPHLPSQQKAIEIFEAKGIQYKVRSLSGSAVDGLRLGHLFKYRYSLTSPFNAPREYGNGLHEGADYDIIGGQVDNVVHVRCPFSGTVYYADPIGIDYPYGKYIEIQCTNNGFPFSIMLAHLDEVYVKEGQRITRGDSVGEIGDTGNSWGEHIHLTLKVPGFGLDGYVEPDVVNPAPYIPDASSLPLYKQQATMDLLPYFCPSVPYGPIYEVQHASGPTETFQVQRQENGREFKLVKNSQWELLFYDDVYIWRGTDTSPGPAPEDAERPGQNRFYIQHEPGLAFARWCKRYMHVGETFKGPGHLVKFFYKSDCAPSVKNSGSATNEITFIQHHPYINFGPGLMICDIIELFNGTERFFFAKNIGMVAWENEKGERSHVSELHEGRPNLKPEHLNCS